LSNANERVASEKLTVEEVFRKLKWQSAYRVEGVRWEAGQPVVAPSEATYVLRVTGSSRIE
jgi:hypothetical protein